MTLFETIEQVKSEQHSDNLIPDICEFMGVDESEFPGQTRNLHDTTIRVIYFAVRYREYIIYGNYTRNNMIEISKVLGRNRDSCYHYKKLLKNDAFMISKTIAFLSKYHYQTQFLDETV